MKPNLDKIYANYSKALKATGLALEPLEKSHQFMLICEMWALPDTTIPYMGSDGVPWVHDLLTNTTDTDQPWAEANLAALKASAKRMKAESKN